MECYSVFKRRKSAICDNMDKAGTRYGKENRPEEKRQILHNIIYMWKLKKERKKWNSWSAERCSGGHQGLGSGGSRGRLTKQHSLSHRWMILDLTHSPVAAADNALLLFSGNLLRE